MNGKELAMALAGAAVVGGAAGAAASLALAPKPETAAAQVPPDVLYRLKAAEDAVAKTSAALEESRKTMNELSERVAAAEIKAAKQAADGAAAPGVHFARTGRHRAAPGAATADAPVEGTVGTDIDLGPALAAGLGDQLGAISGDFSSLQAGLELRKLPETDRWQKAKDDLGLTWNQVEDLKKAVADRDAAMKDAMVSEKKTNASGGTVTIERPNPGKAAHAEADYHDRVDAALSADQRKNWSAKGYDHAFGSSPFGGSGATMVMSFGVSSDKKDGPAKEAPK
jgi:hypothetical protein